MSKAIALLAATAFLLFALGLHAGQPALTDDQIRRYVASLQDLEELGDRIDEDELDPAFDAEDGQVDLESMMKNPMSSAVAALEGHEAYGDFTRIVSRHGFATPQQWGEVGDRVVRAYMTLQMEREQPRVQEEMKQALREIENNPHMSAAQKEQMRTMLEQSMAGMKAMTGAPREDVEAVRANEDAVRLAFE
jgi:hypothetical protein